MIAWSSKVVKGGGEWGQEGEGGREREKIKIISPEICQYQLLSIPLFYNRFVVMRVFEC